MMMARRLHKSTPSTHVLPPTTVTTTATATTTVTTAPCATGGVSWLHGCSAAAGRTEEAGVKPFMVTTPIFYVNSKPHIGHVYTATLADAVARWQRLKGREVLFVTGTDEHGLKVYEAAQAAGMETQEFCDAVSAEYREAMDKVGISYDVWIRTTDECHKTAVHSMWDRLATAGHTVQGTYEGWYSVADETFLAGSQVGDGHHPKTGEPCKVSLESGQPVQRIQEQNYMFSLTKFKSHVRDWLLRDDESSSSNDGRMSNHTLPSVIPKQRLNEALATVDADLPDLSVSRRRDSVQWGIPVPGDDSQLIYVWLDALTNYLSAAGWPGMDNPAWPPDVQVVGKDILKFHAVYWPAILTAAELPLPKTVLAHALWQVEGRKMSKSIGNVVDPLAVADEVGVDTLRYFLLRDGGIANDGEFNHAAVLRRQDELAGQLGNLISRASGKSICPNGRVAERAEVENGGSLNCAEAAAAETELLESLARTPGVVGAAYDRCDFAAGLSAVFDLLSDANAYFQKAEPWRLRKEAAATAKASCNPAVDGGGGGGSSSSGGGGGNGVDSHGSSGHHSATSGGSSDGGAHSCNETVCESAAAAERVVFYTTEAARVASLLLQPIIPSAASAALDHLGVPSHSRSFTAAGELCDGGRVFAASTCKIIERTR